MRRTKKIISVLVIIAILFHGRANGIFAAERKAIVEDDFVRFEDEIRYEKQRYYIDDFDKIEDYIDYCEKNGYTNELVNEYWLGGETAQTKSINANVKYEISGLQSKNAIQNFCTDGDYLYVTQHLGKGNVLLSRCKISGNNASYVDDMKLSNVGHGATLENYTYKNKKYFLITTKSNEVIKNPGTSNEKKVYYSLQVGRIQYMPGQTVDNVDIARFCNLNYANKSNTRFADVERVNAALTTSTDKIMLWVRSSSNSIQYSVYDFSKFNEELDKVDGNSYLAYFSDNSVMKNVCEYSTVQNSSNCVIPNGSFQGIDLANKGDTGKHAVYIASGNEHADNKNLIIARVSYDVENLTLTYKNNVRISGIKKNSTVLTNNEMEGIHVMDTSTLNIGVVHYKADDSKVNYICEVERSDI